MSIPCPKGWSLARLSDLCDFQNGHAFKNGDFQESAEDALIVFKMGNIARGGGLKHEAKNSYFPRRMASKLKRFVLNKGDIVMSMTDMKASMALLGHTAMIDEEDKYLLNQRVGRITVREAAFIDATFLFYFTNSKPYIDYLRGVAHSGVQVNLSTEEIKKSPVALPPLITQRRIASILSAYDDLIENNTRRIEILEEMARRLYEEWFVHFRFPGHEQVSFKETEIGRIPGGWVPTAFSDVATFMNGFAFKPSHFTDGGLPVIKIKELKSGVTKDTPRCSDDIKEKYLIKDGNILFSWSAHLDAYIWRGGDGWLNQHLFKVESLGSLSRLFLYFSLKEKMGEFRAKSMGTTMQHIKRSALREVKFSVPPKILMSKFEDLVTPFLKQVLVLQQKNANLRAQRDLLLPKLVSGEIDVSDLPMPTDTEDEAA